MSLQFEVTLATKPREPKRGSFIALRHLAGYSCLRGRQPACQIEEDSFTFTRDENGIAKQAVLDGIYVMRTSLNKSAINA